MVELCCRPALVSFSSAAEEHRVDTKTGYKDFDQVTRRYSRLIEGAWDV
jgi:hypothetical protein